ncbi:MAG: hypothetical protein LBU40_00265 [Methanobrevibacter sp.]|nr:hypothetical protein [Methanobrevibacter sp.]
MPYGSNKSLTDLFLSVAIKSIICDDNSELFDFELEGNKLYVSTTNAKNTIKLNEFYIEGKTVYVNNHHIEGTDLFYGDLLCDHFDEENNMVNPASDTGWYLYNLFGFVFQSLQEKIGSNLLNICPVTCELDYLDKIAQEFHLIRKPEWSDDYWRALVIYYYYNFETIKGIEFVLNMLYQYGIKDNDDEEPVEIIVDGFAPGFYCSDKFDSFSRCSDKFETVSDKVSNSIEQHFNIIPSNVVFENNIIAELVKILENGAVR